MSDAPRFSPPVAGPEHAVFEKDVGTWDADVVIRMPGAPPTSTRGTCEARRICGGLWLVMDVRMETGFEGHGVYSYNVHKQKYVGTWVDSMRTFIAPMEGTYDAEKRVMTFFVDHTSPNGPMRWRETTETVDHDTQVFRSFMPAPGGGEAEVMTVTYRRRG